MEILQSVPQGRTAGVEKYLFIWESSAERILNNVLYVLYPVMKYPAFGQTAHASRQAGRIAKLRTQSPLPRFQATAEPSQSKVDNVNEPQDGDVHNRVKRELTGDPDGYGPNINVDLEINAGPYAHVAVDVDVNIGQ